MKKKGEEEKIVVIKINNSQSTFDLPGKFCAFAICGKDNIHARNENKLITVSRYYRYSRRQYWYCVVIHGNTCEDFRDVVRDAFTSRSRAYALTFSGHAYTCAPARMQLLMCPRDSEEVGAAFIGAPLHARSDLRGSEATIMARNQCPLACASVRVRDTRNNA